MGSPHRSFGLRVAGMFAGALLYSLVAYLILEWYLPRAGSGAVTLTFLIFVPAALASAVSFASDPEGKKGLQRHLAAAIIPIVAAAIGGVLLREGGICIIMLLPLWSVSALLAAMFTWAVRRFERRANRLKVSAILLLPVMTAQIEVAVPIPTASYAVQRTIVIDAPPARVWPLLLSMTDIRSDEGRWNITQNLLGVPRPTEAVISTRGGLPVRSARRGTDIRFDERIIEWSEGRSLRWNFEFPNDSVREHTDRHVAPDGEQLWIREGSYRLIPLAGNRTELGLATRYDLRTPLNGYAAWWGDRMLGDIQRNVLQIIKDRAERSE
jgi:hypothetical protein